MMKNFIPAYMPEKEEDANQTLSAGVNYGQKNHVEQRNSPILCM